MLPSYAPGRLIAIDIGLGLEHFGILSERPRSGLPMVISLSARTNCVQEESWQTVVGSGKWRYATELEGRLPAWVVLIRARAMLGLRGYSVVSRNCEHFARAAAGCSVESKQVQNVLTLFLLLGLAFVATRRQ